MIKLDWTIPAIALTLTSLVFIWLRTRLERLRTSPKNLNRKKEDETHLKAIFNKVLKLLEEDEIFLNKQIKVSDLAKEVNQTEKCISKAINKFSNGNFNSLINSFRVKYSKELMAGGKFDHYTIEAIAEESGFANKVSFYHAFKNSTGMSPKEFRELKQSQRVKP